MTRRMWSGGCGLLLCLGTLAFLGFRTLEREREAAQDEFARLQLHELDGAAGTLGASLVQIGDDLTLAGALLDESTDESLSDRQLAAIVARRHGLLLLVASAGADGAPRAVAPDARADVLALASPVIDRLLEAARREPGQLQVSAGLSDHDDVPAWFRVFASAPRTGGRAVAAVIDMRLRVMPSQLLRTPTSRLLVLSAHGVPAPATDPAMAALVGGLRAGTIDDEALHALLERAEDRREGTAQVTAERARSLGLPSAAAVAAAVPVVIDRGRPWVLMLVSSTETLDAHQRTTLARMAAGSLFALVLVILAASYVVRTARRTEAMRERLRHVDLLLRSEKLATAGQLAAGIAHEIGTPLNVARGRAELTLQKIGGEHPQAHNQEVIVGQIDHVTRLIQQLLDYVRPEPATTHGIVVADAQRAVAGLLAAQAASRKVELRVEPDVRGAVVRADPSQLQQILVNLVMNAIDACGPDGHVTLSTASRDGAVGIEVTDDGAGILPEHRALIFDPFFTTKKRGQGTGLGLWVVAQLVRAHGAEIELAAAAGPAGTTFRIWWPTAVETRA